MDGGIGSSARFRDVINGRNIRSQALCERCTRRRVDAPFDIRNEGFPYLGRCEFRVDKRPRGQCVLFTHRHSRARSPTQTAVASKVGDGARADSDGGCARARANETYGNGNRINAHRERNSVPANESDERTKALDMGPRQMMSDKGKII